MTVFRLERGTRVTYNGIAAAVERRAIEPVGYWVRSERDPEYVFVVTDDEIALAVEEKGPLRLVGSPAKAEPASGVPEASRLTERDHLVMAYRRRVADAVDRALKDSSPRLTKTAATRVAIAAVAPPTGVTPITPRTASGHLRTWKRSGCKPLALAPMNARKGNRTVRKPGFVLDAVEDAIDEKFRGWGSSPIVRQHAIAIARLTWENVYRKAHVVDGLELRLDKDGDVDWMELVSAPYVRTRVNLRSARFRAERSFGPEQARKSFDTALAGPLATQPLAVVEGDDMFLTNVFVVDDEDWFPLGYPVVTFLLDCATQAAVGRFVGFGSPTSDSVVKAYEHAAYPKDLSTMVDEDGKQLFSRQWTAGGKIQVLKSDMGSNYLSQHVEDAAYRGGTVLHPLPPGSPKLKGRVERFIRTFKEGSAGDALRILPRRLRDKLRPDGGPLLVTLRELLLIIDYWIVEVYHEDIHHTHGMPPREAWEKWTRQMPVDPPPSREEIRLMMGKYVPSRTLNKNGLRLHGLEFNSTGIGALRADHGGLDGIMRDVEVKYLVEDISAAWALFPDPHRPGNTLGVPAYCKQMHYARGLSEYRHWVITEHAKESATQGVITVHQLMEAKQRLARIAADMYAQRLANGGTAKVDAVLKAHRTYLKEPKELPEDAPDARDELSLIDRETFPDARPEQTERTSKDLKTDSVGSTRTGGRTRRKLGRLDDV